MKTIDAIQQQWALIKDSLNERMRRQWAASESLSLGFGGREAVERATGLASSTIGHGINELRAKQRGETDNLVLDPARSRRPGGGRRSSADRQPELLGALERLISPDARGDPETPLRWVGKSKETLAGELAQQKFKVSPSTVGRLMKRLGYTLQGNAKTLEGRQHPDRDAQFQYINKQIREHQQSGDPATSVDTKKKELVGQYLNRGKEWLPKGQPTKVDCHDFMGELGRASPYGVYDMTDNTGWVSVGISADTSEFAVESLRRWWRQMGQPRYPNAKRLLITADCGGSNGYRVRLWKLELQKLADELNIAITVCHLPPSTSKWNRIEHALFSFISINWRGKPLVDYQTIVRLIGATTTTTGLRVQCALDERTYEKGRSVSNAEMAALNLQPHEFHGEWNYTFGPRQPATVGSS